jgi:RimJ/RimL family protein N-acetyltransferase
MNDTLRLSYIPFPTPAELEELWQNCFDTPEKLQHINKYVPYAVTSFSQIRGFLSNEQKGYRFWLVRRKIEKDIIGFAIHGNYFPGYTNDVGFNIGLHYVGKGYATETLNELTRFVGSLGYKETFGHCYENNLPAIKTMERCGYVNQGRTGREFFGNHVIELKYVF